MIGLINPLPKRKWQRLVSFFVVILLNFSFIDVFVTLTISNSDGWTNWKMILGYFATKSLLLLSWYSMFFRKKNILHLLQKIELMTTPMMKHKINACFMFAAFLYFICFPIVTTASMNREYLDVYSQYFMYRLDIENIVFKCICYAVKMLLHFNFIQFCNSVILLLYLTVCHYVTASLEKFKDDIVSMPPEEFLKEQPGLSERYSKIIAVLQDTQQTFSLTSFLQCLGFIASSFSTLSFLLLYPEGVSTPVLFESIFILVTASFSIISIFYIGGRIPIKMVEVRNAFHAKCATIPPGRYGPYIRFEFFALSKFVDLPGMVLSGCDILYYTKENIFSAMGSFITYSLLLLQFNSQTLSNK
ncbi:hypothetical protein TNCT_697931 [Trichonephila clavata]|uniref:Gustatory receptor n=1 Tax=Trichonephila clavata TaxID=2740835 RepID=A0A8X6K8Z4_TRICU|nr:hypothetical protein TNCT_697931 [Trichonephila clavata]